MNKETVLATAQQFGVQRRNLLLFIILLLGFVLRAYACFFTDLPHMHQDSPDYFKQAAAILDGDYINYFPNGYPLLIAFFDLLPGPFSPINMVWANLLMSMATIWLVYRISKEVFQNEYIALATALLIAVFPTQINLVRWLTSEIAVTFFMLAGYLLFLRKRYVFSGLCFAMSSLIRTEIIFIVLLIVLFEWWCTRKFNWRLSLSVIIPLLAIAYWSYTETGHFAISGHGKVNIMYAITASGSDIDWQYADKHPEITTSSEALKAYFRHATQNPGTFLIQKWYNFSEMWGVPSSAGGTRSTASRIVIAAGNLFLAIFGVAGWWLNRNRKNVFVLIFPFLVITGMHTMMFALPRYTFPAEPLLMVTAVWMLFYILQRLRSLYIKS